MQHVFWSSTVASCKNDQRNEQKSKLVNHEIGNQHLPNDDEKIDAAAFVVLAVVTVDVVIIVVVVVGNDAVVVEVPNKLLVTGLAANVTPPAAVEDELAGEVNVLPNMLPAPGKNRNP